MARFRDHENCEEHRISMEKYTLYMNSLISGSVIRKLSDAHNVEADLNSIYLYKILDLLKYLATQGLAFKGNNEKDESNNQGNFQELCKLFAKFDSEFKLKYGNTYNYTSPKVQNELLHFLSCAVINQISD